MTNYNELIEICLHKKHMLLPNDLFEKFSEADVREFLKYLIIAGYTKAQPDNQFYYVKPPLVKGSEIVDEIWHHCVNTTRKYRELCKHFQIEFLDHTPKCDMVVDKYNNFDFLNFFSHACDLHTVFFPGEECRWDDPNREIEKAKQLAEEAKKRSEQAKKTAEEEQKKIFQAEEERKRCENDYWRYQNCG